MPTDSDEPDAVAVVRRAGAAKWRAPWPVVRTVLVRTVHVRTADGPRPDL